MAGGKKLLVADDSLTIQKVIRLALSNEGYDIQAISDGADAIQQIATFRPDCVLIDVSLPTQTAFEIKREVNGMPDHRGVRFILMSSAFEKIDETQAAEVEFDGRLTKPFDPAHLRQVLAEVLSRPMAPQESPAEPPAELPDISNTGITLQAPKEFPAPSFDEPKLDEDELWGRHEESPPPIPGTEGTGNDEIKQLTESTIRMSGLAEWEVSEPSLKPPGSMGDIGESTFQLDASKQPKQSPISSAPSLELDHDAYVPESEVTKPDFTRPREIHREPPREPSRQDPSAFTSDARMEEMIRRQVQETLEKMAQQILPEVAERVIKAEINRLLNEKL